MYKQSFNSDMRNALKIVVSVLSIWCCRIRAIFSLSHRYLISTFDILVICKSKRRRIHIPAILVNRRNPEFFADTAEIRLHVAIRQSHIFDNHRNSRFGDPYHLIHPFTRPVLLFRLSHLVKLLAFPVLLFGMAQLIVKIVISDE